LQTLIFFPFTHPGQKDVAVPIEDGRFENENEFNKADKRDEFENSKTGQQVKRCNYLADFIIVNDGHTAPTMATWHEDFVRDIYRHYIKLIENNANGEDSPEISPSINEMCMTSAYAQSVMSSCLKRKVGSVIIDLEDISKPDDGHDRVIKYP
jgi:deoxycytidylate deaminase